MNKINVKIFQIINGLTSAVSANDGQKVFEFVLKILKNKNIAVIDFSDIELVTSAFLNSSIGQLYGEFKSSYLDKNVEFINIEEDDKEILADVIETAIEYYKNPENINRIIDKVLDDE